MGDFDLYEMLLRVPPLLFALTIHEYAHGWVAWRCGDPTAKNLGRLSFNPIVHLDPIGALCLLFAPIGWAKPVPVNPYNFRNPRRDDILVSLAGIGANLATAVVAALVFRLALGLGAIGSSPVAQAVWTMVVVLVQISVGLAIFNIIPVPPLDGSHVLKNLLPYDMAAAYQRLAPVTSMIFLVLVVAGAFNSFLGWPVFFIVRLLLGS